MRRALVVAGALLLALAPHLVPAGEPPPIVLLGALEGETRPVEAVLESPGPVQVPGIPCVRGTLGGRRVVVAVTGVGKVNAAMATALLLERFSPEAAIFSGIAGALDPQLQPGDVVVGEKLVQHDLVNHAEVCHQRGVPFLVVRGLSDRAGSGARDEARRHLGVAARNAACIATAVARLLGAERP